MTAGILVTYATRHDATRGIASAIADVFREAGQSVELEPISATSTLSGFGAVVVGTATYDGEWLPELEEFLRSHSVTLARVPVWIFISGSVDAIPSGPAGDVPARLVRAVDDVRPRDVALFAGLLQPHHVAAGLPVLARLARIPAADHRDWRAIERWAVAIRDALIPAGTADAAVAAAEVLVST